MEKLKLNLDTVEVQSFEVTRGTGAMPGTVHAAEDLTRCDCGITCHASCCHTAPGQE